MSEDQTEGIRRVLTIETNTKMAERAALEREHGEVWDTDELQHDFDVLGFLAPFIHVTRKQDGAEGSMMFQHSPRYYWGFKHS